MLALHKGKRKKCDITKDQWNMFHLFLTKTDGSIANYKIEDAWPVVIDEFVEYMESEESGNK